MSDGYVCPECGLDYDSILPADAKAAMRSYPRRFAELLPTRDDDEKPDGVIRRRPEPTVWSVLEYTMHVGEVEGELADIVEAMVRDKALPPMNDPDERAMAAKYNEEDRDAALEKLTAGCEKMAKVIEDVPNDAWSKTAKFPWGERDALTMTRNAVHEGHHHLRDVENVLRRVVGN